jgi:hypothetical protein
VSEQAKIRSDSEREWVTGAGLYAVVVFHECSFLNYRCGYVEVPGSSLLFGVDYSSNPPGYDRSVDELIDVYGGVTYAGEMAGKGRWFIGFDCAHGVGNPLFEVKSLEFCVDECERLAKQIAELGQLEKGGRDGQARS